MRSQKAAALARLFCQGRAAIRCVPRAPVSFLSERSKFRRIQSNAAPSFHTVAAIQPRPVARSMTVSLGRAETLHHARNAMSTVASGDQPRVHVLYGSQTGNAMGFALQLQEACNGVGLGGRRSSGEASSTVECLEMNEFDPAMLLQSADDPKNDVLVFIGACYGRGEPTDNAKKFYDWVMSPAAQESQLLQGVPFCVFGLGRSKTYCDQYQNVGRTLDARLEELGAVRLTARGEGDDDGDIEEDWENWEQRFWLKFNELYPPGPANAATLAPADGGAKFSLSYLETGAPVRSIDLIPRLNTHKGPLPFDVLSVDELRPKPNTTSRDTYHVVLRDEHFKYCTGDHLGVWPKNHPELVEWMGERLGVALDQPLSCAPGHPLTMTPDVPDPTDFRTLFERFIDFTGPIKRRMLRACAEHAQDPAEAGVLRGLADDDGAFADYTGLGDGHSLFEVLTEHTSIKLPVNDIIRIGLVNPMQYRYYSIASSALAEDNVALCVDKLTRNVKSGRVHKGACSHYLGGLRPGVDHCRAFLRQSPVRAPASPSTPMILVGAASGMALLRALAVERAWHAARGTHVGSMTMFYGCFLEADFLYADLMRQFEKEGLLTLFPAFSHEQDERVFVQHRMMEQADLLWNLLTREHAQMYVCGNSTTIGKGVNDVLCELAAMFEGLSPPEAQQFVRKLMTTGQIVEDVF